MPDAIDPLQRFFGSRCCIVCEFSLDGWPQHAICPQCGQRELDDVLTLRGWDPTVPRLTRPREWIVTTLIGGLMIWAGVAVAYASGGSAIGWGFVVLGLLVGAGPAIQRITWRRSTDDAGHPPVRCHLSPLGIATAVGNQCSDWAMWQPDWRVTIHGPNPWGAGWLIVRPRVSFLSGGRPQPLLRFDFNATRSELEAIQLQITCWIEDQRAGGGFEVLPIRPAD